jgi:hypothetical protein
MYCWTVQGDILGFYDSVTPNFSVLKKIQLKKGFKDWIKIFMS